MIADDFQAIREAMQPSPAPQESKPVPLGFFAWVRETSGGNVCLEYVRLRRAGLVS